MKISMHCCKFSADCTDMIILEGHRDGIYNKLRFLISTDNLMLATLFSAAALLS